ncbi:MAG: hydrogenase iron-sulfur subunit [Anaerolineae bacterium]|jgi:coenzyme F420-reducing hydrogenase delta subunit
MDKEGNGRGEFVPEITALTCIYCGYMSADTAGTLRFTYPSNVKLVRLPCTGKVDVCHLLNAFEEGADGVYVVACAIGNCHHVHGNDRAVKRVEYTKKLLDEVGIGGERLDMVFTTGGMGATFANAAKRMTERVKKLGPNPLKKTVKEE